MPRLHCIKFMDTCQEEAAKLFPLSNSNNSDKVLRLDSPEFGSEIPKPRPSQQFYIDVGQQLAIWHVASVALSFWSFWRSTASRAFPWPTSTHLEGRLEISLCAQTMMALRPPFHSTCPFPSLIFYTALYTYVRYYNYSN